MNNIILSSLFLWLSIEFSQYDTVMQLGCFLIGLGLFLKFLTSLKKIDTIKK